MKKQKKKLNKKNSKIKNKQKIKKIFKKLKKRNIKKTNVKRKKTSRKYPIKKTKKTKKNKKIIKKSRLVNSRKPGFLLKIINFQNSLKPNINLKLNFSFEKYIQAFFDKISETISQYKIIKKDEARRIKLEKQEQEILEKI